MSQEKLIPADQTKCAELARFVVRTTFEDLPEAIAQKAVRHILDSIGAGTAGAIAPETTILTQTLHAAGEGSGAAPLWGRGEKMTPLNAALVNGTASHAFELDDTGGCDHSGAVVVPAAVAALELAGRPVSGKEFITAVVLGYDIARRALEACGAYEPHNGAGFHSTGTCGPFGAAAAAAKILGLNALQTRHALGIASAYSGGLWACVHDGAQNKRLHAGHAAQGGLMSALLARQGFTGPAQAFEEVWGGFNHSYAPTSSDPDAWLRDLGKNWKLARVSIKPHASCRSTHSSIDAVDNLMAKYGFKADEIAEILIIINPFVYGMCGGTAIHPMNAAQLSIPYSVAADLVFGSASLASFTREKREDPRIAETMAKIRFEVDKRQKDDDEPIVQVTLKDGRAFETRVPMPLGSPVNPVTDEALLKKFRSVVGMVLTPADVDALAERLLSLIEVTDVRAEVAEILGRTPANREVFRA